MVKFNTDFFKCNGHAINIKMFSKKQRKVVFLVIDETWQLFCQTGNIEAYLLLKELENGTETHESQNASVQEPVGKTKM